tara:strand:+ start:26599 stop:27189 length:591 start_codon:yes stop_codon:yes gene_type:complete
MRGDRLECIILAAGSSRRLGRDKALIEIGSQTLIGWISGRLSSRFADLTVVVNQGNFGEISRLLPNANVILNPEPDKGRTGSLKVGISSIDSSRGTEYRLLVVPVDRPGFSDSTLERLLSSEETCCPMKKGRGGHPLMISNDDVKKVRVSSAHLPLKEIIEASRFEVFDRFLDLNIDTPEDVRNLSEKLDSVNEEN